MLKLGRRRGASQRARERANLSFFIVVMFFAVFGVIVLTEIFLIDERSRGSGDASAGRPHGLQDRPDYDEQLQPQGDDYLIYRGAGFDDALGVYIREGQPRPAPAARPPHDGAAPARLPPLTGNLTARDGRWQTVSHTRYKFFVFSAFYDRREERSVRVIGATKTRGPERVWCRLWYNTTTNASHSISVQAKVKVIRENWNLKYSACFVLCPLGRNLSAPLSVSVVSRLKLPPTNLLRVLNTEPDLHKNISEGLAVCVKPLHFHYNQALQMLEFVELNRLLGARHFVLYNHTLGPTVECILQHYVAEGLVTLLPWQLNMLSQKEIRTEGLFAALNDCLYRSMYRFSLAALIDLDEFIIPQHNNTIPDLIQWLGTRMNTRNTGSYSFQNAFFYLQWGDEAGGEKLLTLRKTRRRAKLHPHKQRSKYVCRPHLAVEAGNHFVWELLPGRATLNVPPHAALLHHYRVCEFGGDDCVKAPSVVDRTAHRYAAPLKQRVQQRWDSLATPCGLDPLRV